MDKVINYLSATAYELKSQKYNHDNNIGDCENGCSALCIWSKDTNFGDELMYLFIEYCVEREISFKDAEVAVRYYEKLVRLFS